VECAQVVISSLSDMTVGPAKELFLEWCSHPVNTVLFTSKGKRGTLASVIRKSRKHGGGSEFILDVPVRYCVVGGGFGCVVFVPFVTLVRCIRGDSCSHARTWRVLSLKTGLPDAKQIAIVSVSFESVLSFATVSPSNGCGAIVRCQEARDLEVRKRLDDERRELEVETRLHEDVVTDSGSLQAEELEEGQVPYAEANGVYHALPCP
jgi:hypothetical protein